MGGQDHHPIGGVLDDGIQSLLLFLQFLVEASVVHGDGGLIGEGGQHLAVVGRKVHLAGAKDVDDADEVPALHQRQSHHLAQPYDSRHQPQFDAQSRNGPAGEVTAFGAQGYLGEQRGKQVKQFQRQAVGDPDPVATVGLVQGNESPLAIDHLHRVAHY